MSNVIITGGAGFIGSHLARRLLKEGYHVTVIDNLKTGKKEFLSECFENQNFKFVFADLLKDEIDKYFKGIDTVFHFAADSDVRTGVKNPKKQIEENIIATHRVLECMREIGVKRIVFTSSSTVYGEARKIPTPEDYSPLEPVSIYGATKLSCEALISAYCHTFDMEGVIFRLANVIGKPVTHGVIYDFIQKLKKNPNELEILGDGEQNKSYIDVDDCIDAIFVGIRHAKKPFDVFNVGSDDTIKVRRIAEIVSESMGLKPRFVFTGSKYGWKGDIPVMLLDTTKLKRFGWKPKYTSEEAVKRCF